MVPSFNGRTLDFCFVCQNFTVRAQNLGIAQLVELPSIKRSVVGSTPTTIKNGERQGSRSPASPYGLIMHPLHSKKLVKERIVSNLRTIKGINKERAEVIYEVLMSSLQDHVAEHKELYLTGMFHIKPVQMKAWKSGEKKKEIPETLRFSLKMTRGLKDIINPHLSTSMKNKERKKKRREEKDNLKLEKRED